MVDIQASLSARFDGLQQSMDATHSAILRQSEIMQAQLRGEKWFRLPLITGKAVSSVLQAGFPQTVGPDGGWAWSLRRIVITGMTRGATPDIVDLFFNDFTTQPVWEFNGNNFGYTFGRLELVMRPGDVLLMQSVGTFAATGNVTLSGEYIELPAEQLAKLAN